MLFTTNLLIDKRGRELRDHAEDGFPLDIFQNDIWKYEKHDVPWHWHRECEFIYVYEGSIIAEYAGRGEVLNKGESCFYNSNFLHAAAANNNSPGKFITLWFDACVISGSPRGVIYDKCVLPVIGREDLGMQVFKTGTAEGAAVSGIINNILRDAANNGFDRELLLRESLSRLWALIYARAQNIPAGTRPANDAYIKAALTYIHGNYQNPITIADIAQNINSSPSTLTRRFRLCTGMSIMDYITDFRVRSAVQKLCFTDDTITKICFECGFNDPSYFTKVFVKTVGNTPTGYRKALKKK